MVRLETVLKMDLSATGGVLRVPTTKLTNNPPEEKEIIDSKVPLNGNMLVFRMGYFT